MKDITKPIGLALFVILILLAFCSKSDAEQPWGDAYNLKYGGVCYQVGDEFGGKTYGMCDDSSIKNHKIWAKEYHSQFKNDKERYELLNESIIGHDIKFKPKRINFLGFIEEQTMKSKFSNGGSAIIIGAEEFAYTGKTFWSVHVDLSKCRNNGWGFTDCLQDGGSSRVEVGDKNEWSFVEGTDKWINYAILPANNILFKDDKRRFTVGQCHPGEAPISWMIKFKGGHLMLEHNYRSMQSVDGIWSKVPMYSSHSLLKRFDINERHGSMEWTNVRIHFVNSKKPEKGLLHIWIDGKLLWEYNGPTNYNLKETNTGSKCQLHFGLYTNDNLRADHPALAENMTVWYDAMAIAKTEEKLIKLLNKEKTK